MVNLVKLDQHCCFPTLCTIFYAPVKRVPTIVNSYTAKTDTACVRLSGLKLQLLTFGLTARVRLPDTVWVCHSTIHYFVNSCMKYVRIKLNHRDSDLMGLAFISRTRIPFSCSNGVHLV